MVRREAAALAAELRRELPPGHPLVAREWQVVGRRDDDDDVLLGISCTTTQAVVHLTWQVERDLAWPHVVFYDSVNEWAASCADVPSKPPR